MHRHDNPLAADTFSRGETAVQTIPRSTVVFEYSSSSEPCATIAPGETVLVETQWAFGEFEVKAGDTLSDLDSSKCDPLTGPLFVEGAEPGDTLAVEILEMELVGQGGQGIIPGLGVLPWEDLPVSMFTPRDGHIEWLRGIRIPIRPNLGCIGVAPESGAIPSIWPGDHGGNMDTRYCCAGSTIYFPVFHPGALLVMGDAHQMQGDGELCGVAPETASDVTLRCEVIKGKTIKRPRILSTSLFMTIASAETLEQAIKLATSDFIDVLVEQKGFTRDEAYLMTAVEAHAEICQVVDPLMTARVTMDRTFFEAL
jgi:amidase